MLLFSNLLSHLKSQFSFRKLIIINIVLISLNLNYCKKRGAALQKAKNVRPPGGSNPRPLD